MTDPKFKVTLTGDKALDSERLPLAAGKPYALTPTRYALSVERDDVEVVRFEGDHIETMAPGFDALREMVDRANTHIDVLAVIWIVRWTDEGSILGAYSSVEKALAAFPDAQHPRPKEFMGPRPSWCWVEPVEVDS